MEIKSGRLVKSIPLTITCRGVINKIGSVDSEVVWIAAAYFNARKNPICKVNFKDSCKSADDALRLLDSRLGVQTGDGATHNIWLDVIFSPDNVIKDVKMSGE